MPLLLSRCLAIAFGVVLAVAETAINESKPHWQFAPLWIIDFVMAAWLVAAGVAARREKYVPLLLAGWGLTIGVFYMAFFVSLDPEIRAAFPVNDRLVALVGFGLGAAVLGFLLAAAGMFRRPTS
jgi:hypothetical protein